MQPASTEDFVDLRTRSNEDNINDTVLFLELIDDAVLAARSRHWQAEKTFVTFK